jgi:Ca2+-transporting ATPase
MKMGTGYGLGLTEAEAARRLEAHGPNLIESTGKKRPLSIFLGQFKDMMVMVLLAATAVSALMGEAVEAMAIIAIVLLNALLGFFQEYRTERTLEALKRMASPQAKVVRGGRVLLIDAAEVVPGDLIVIEAGDRIPADAYVCEATELCCDESMLTGESVPVSKRAAPPGQIDYTLEERVYMGTMATRGKGQAVVTGTGMDTEMGGIAHMLGSIEEGETPLQERLDQVGRYIAVGCLIICAVVAAVGIVRGENPLDMLIVGISLAVAAVPEGLPAIVTISLAIAVGRILRRGALVKRLHAVETLGCATVICSDKTGTLTENRMTVTRVWSLSEGAVGREAFAGAGGSPAGSRMADIAAICSNVDAEAAREGTGDPTEVALVRMAAAMGGPQADWRRIGEVPFDSDRKRMAVIATRGGVTRSFVKGAPEVLLPRCREVLEGGQTRPITAVHRQKITDQAAAMAGDALRVIGLAYTDLSSPGADPEQALVFVGLAGMVDPPRPEVYKAVHACRTASIRPVMITGDHAATAKAIAMDLGICTARDEVVTGAMLDAMSDAQLAERCRTAQVYARVSPAHKLRIVRAIKAQGEVVAMTGDGVNDAPAVKEADIGVAMGISGTDVTKEASDMVLLDDNFATIVASVEEGRIVYKNIRRSIRYLLSCNIGEILTMFGGMLLGAPVILTPIQLLLVNLVTDGLPAIALSVEPGHPDIMEDPPRSRDESIFAGGLWGRMAFRGVLIGIVTLLSFSTFMRVTGDLATARCAALMTLIFSQLFHVIECRSEKRTIFEINPFGNPALLLADATSAAIALLCVYEPHLAAILEVAPLTLSQLGFCLGVAAVTPVVTAIVGFIGRMFGHKSPQPIALHTTKPHRVRQY